MALQFIPGEGAWLGYALDGGWATSTPALGSSTALSASGRKFAFIGQVFHKNYGTNLTIDKVHFLVGGTPVCVGNFRVSLQDVSATSGPPAQPDGTVDQYRTMTGISAGWQATGLVTSDGTDGGTKRTVNAGEMLAIVFDWSSFNAGDTITIQGLSSAFNGGGDVQRPGSVYYDGSSWGVAGAAIVPNVILEFSDGTFGTLSHSFPVKSFSSIAFNNASAADDIGLEFQVPFPCKIDAARVWMIGGGGTNGNFDVFVYDGASPPALIANGTINVDGNQIGDPGVARLGTFTFATPVQLAANTTYRLTVCAQGSGNITLYYFDVNANGHFQAHSLGATGIYASREQDGNGNFSTTNTRRPFIAFRVCAFDDGAGGGGGGGLRLAGHGGLAA